MGQVHNDIVLDRLKISDGRCLQSASPDARRRLGEFWTKSVCTAAERSWFMLGYSVLGQEQVVGLLDSRPGFAKNSLANVR